MKEHRRLTIVIVSAVILSLVVIAGASIAAGGKVPPPNPEEGLTDEQRMALHSAGVQQFEERYASRIAGLDLSSVSSFPHSGMSGIAEPPMPSLQAAKAHASVIVVAVVTALKPDPSFLTIVSLHVVRNVKGTTAADITIYQDSHLEPNSDWSGAIIVDAQWDPLMLPGDRVVLFLNPAAHIPGTYEIQPATGIYHSVNGKMSCLPDNPFAASVNGKDESALIADINAAN